MRVVLIAPFIIDRHPTLRSSALYEAAVEQRALDEIEGFRPRPGGTKATLSIDPEHPLAGATLNGPLLDGFISVRAPQVGESGESSTAHEVRVVVGKLGVGFFVVSTQADSLARPPELESVLTKPLNDLIEVVSGVVANSVPAQDLVSWRQASLMPKGIAWWHRLGVGVKRGEEPKNAAYGQVLRSGADELGLLGSGFSVLWKSDPIVEKECVDGIFAATEEWLVIDGVNSLLADRLSSLESTTGARRMELLRAIHAEILDVSVEVAIVKLLIDERARYLVAAERATRAAARDSWSMTVEYESLDSRLSTLRQLAEAHRNEIQSRRDARRNDLLFAFTTMAIIQSLLVVFDFLTGSNDTLAPVPRVVYGVAVTVIALSVLGFGVFRLTGGRD
jgi:hypothetical protein